MVSRIVTLLVLITGGCMYGADQSRDETENWHPWVPGPYYVNVALWEKNYLPLTSAPKEIYPIPVDQHYTFADICNKLTAYKQREVIIRGVFNPLHIPLEPMRLSQRLKDHEWVVYNQRNAATIIATFKTE